MRNPPLAYAPNPEEDEDLSFLSNELGPLPVTEGKPPLVNDVPPAQEPVYTSDPPSTEPNPPVPEPPAQEVAQAPEPAQPQELRQPDWKDYLLGPSSSQSSTESTPSTLTNKAPNWYDFDAPPEYTGNAPALLALAAGLIQAGVAPDKKSALAMLAGGAADALSVKLAAPGVDYKNRLESAGKQAQMMATLRGSGSETLGWERLKLAREKMDAAAQTTAEKARLKSALDRMDSPETRQLQDAAAVWMGPKAYELSGSQLGWARPQFSQAARQDEAAQNALTSYNRRQTGQVEQEQRGNLEHDRRFEMEQGATLDKEERERSKGLAQANLPGREWQAGYAPSNADVAAARQTLISKNSAVRAAQELADLQDQVSLIAQGGGTLYTVFGSDERQKQILARMKTLQNGLAANLRNIFHMGVPQQFEVALNEGINPGADKITTFFRGPSAWRQLAAEAEMAGEQTLEMGFGSKRLTPGTAQTVPQLIKGENMSLPKKQGMKRVQEAGQALDSPSEVIPQAIELGKKAVGSAVRTAEQVAAPAKEAVRTIKIQLQNPQNPEGGWSSPREITIDKYRELVRKLQNKGIRKAVE